MRKSMLKYFLLPFLFFCSVGFSQPNVSQEQLFAYAYEPRHRNLRLLNGSFSKGQTKPRNQTMNLDLEYFYELPIPKIESLPNLEELKNSPEYYTPFGGNPNKLEEGDYLFLSGLVNSSCYAIERIKEMRFKYNRLEASVKQSGATYKLRDESTSLRLKIRREKQGGNFGIKALFYIEKEFGLPRKVLQLRNKKREKDKSKTHISTT